jgi:hypothetical protein
MDDSLRMACIVVLGEQSGATFDWSSLRWTERNY